MVQEQRELSRRTLFGLAGATAAAATLAACGSPRHSAVVVPSEVPITVEDAPTPKKP